MKPTKPRWESEAAMLAAFVARATAQGWRCYAESCGHDVIMVLTDADRAARLGLAVGDTVAVEGKLRLSMAVLRQATPPWRRNGWEPDQTRSAGFYAVVVPAYDGDGRDVADTLGITVWVQAPPESGRWRDDGLVLDPGTRCVGSPPLDLPSIWVDMPAGVPAPRQLTPWKIAAVQLCLAGRDRVLTRGDFGRGPVTVRSFRDRGWIEHVAGTGKAATWRLVESETRPDAVYPEIAAALAAEAAK